MALACAVARADDSLEAVFRDPPRQARPMVWWHWMGRNVSKDGITRDLDAMKAAGIGGATIFNLTSSVQASEAPLLNTPWPDNGYRGPAWWKLVEHAAKEADRLGLNLGMHNCVGYSATGGPWITPEQSMKVVVWKSLAVTGGTAFAGKLPQPQAKLDFYRDIGVVAVPAGAPTAAASVLDLSRALGADGSLHWDVPPGEWTVYRFGYTATGQGCHPAPEEVQTLECDKLSAAASGYHFDQVLQPLRDHLGPLLGKSLQHLTLDSYEAGNLNWTEGFRDEFQRRRGYDPLVWLPTLDKCVIGNPDLTSRFAWDLKTTVSDLFVQNHFRQGKAQMNALGVAMYLEPYSGPFSTPEAAAVPDMTMGEFWLGSGGEIGRNIVGAAQAAGIQVIGAEAFTAKPTVAKFSETPAQLKACGDGAWTSGINQLFLHHWVHQPFGDDLKPGMGMGWWGTHFGRHQTWYEPGKAWLAYLGRAQALLQRGEPVADYLALDQGADLGGNRADVISAVGLVAGAKVLDGRIHLPSGRSYAFLLLPNTPQMLPATARKLKEMVAAGAVIAGPRPDRSPSMRDFPAADAEVAALAGELWGTMGQGKVFASAAQALAAVHLGPDFSLPPGSASLRYSHRRDGATDLYFVTSSAAAPITVTASFRVSGKIPELWDAENGSQRTAPVWRIKDHRTELDLTLEANTSVFIVFRQATESLASAPLPLTPPAPAPLALDGPWQVDFGQGRSHTLPTLVSWTMADDPAVKFFSGTATYSRSLDITAANPQLTLDLGDVRELARVKVNGIDCGVAWHAPFRVRIGPALRAGRNSLEIQVTNTWANRLIGDESEAADATYSAHINQRHFKDQAGQPLPVGRMLVEFPDWLIRGQPRPSKRQTFCTWNYFTKDSPLMESGMLGPVRLSAGH